MNLQQHIGLLTNQDIANTVNMHLYWPFLKQDWKGKAQKYREDLDTGALEELKCPTCQKGFKRNKDYKYHMKDCRECECDIPGCGKTFDHMKKLERHKSKVHLQTFKCDVCSKVFAEKRNLKRHESTHKWKLTRVILRNPYLTISVYLSKLNKGKQYS